MNRSLSPLRCAALALLLLALPAASALARGAVPAIRAIPNAQLTAAVGQPYTLALAAHAMAGEDGAIHAYVLKGALPVWLSFDAATGVLHGTPTSVGNFAFTATATGQGGTGAPRGFTITAVAVGQGAGKPPQPAPALGRARLALAAWLTGVAGWWRQLGA